MATENQELRKAGLKVTLPRVKILQIMESSETKHLSAEDVYKALIEAARAARLEAIQVDILTREQFLGLESQFEDQPPAPKLAVNG